MKNKIVSYLLAATVVLAPVAAPAIASASTLDELSVQSTVEVSAVSKIAEATNSAQQIADYAEWLKEQSKKHGWLTANLNVRQNPNTDCAVLAVLPFGSQVEYYDYNDEWTYIEYNGTVAYLNKSYITDDEQLIQEMIAEKQREEEERKNRNYSEDDLYVLSHVIYAEAGGGSRDEMIGAGSVVLNRVNHKDYPNTIQEVVFAKGQYACTWDGNYEKIPSKTAVEIAEYLLQNGSQFPANVVYQAEFLQGRGVYAKEGRTYFCYK